MSKYVQIQLKMQIQIQIQVQIQIRSRNIVEIQQKQNNYTIILLGNQWILYWIVDLVERNGVELCIFVIYIDIETAMLFDIY